MEKWSKNRPKNQRQSSHPFHKNTKLKKVVATVTQLIARADLTDLSVYAGLPFFPLGVFFSQYNLPGIEEDQSAL